MTEGRKSSGFSPASNVLRTMVNGGDKLRKPETAQFRWLRSSAREATLFLSPILHHPEVTLCGRQDAEIQLLTNFFFTHKGS